MDRRFEIVITEVCEERRVRGQEWKIGAGDTPEEYGHTPEIEKMEQITREIFKQNLERHALVAVIMQYNGT